MLKVESALSHNYGDFPAGTDVHNSAASRHKPHSEECAVIWIKLWWMQPENQDVLRLVTRHWNRWQRTDSPASSACRSTAFALKTPLCFGWRSAAAMASPQCASPLLKCGHLIELPPGPPVT